jgi:hypothetical protein
MIETRMFPCGCTVYLRVNGTKISIESEIRCQDHKKNHDLNPLQ